MNKCKCLCEYCKTGEHCGDRNCGREYTSKTKRGECMTEHCPNPRQDGSRYCVDCSYNYYLKKNGRKNNK